MARSSAEVMAQFEKYVIGNYKRYPICLVRGEGSWVWDAEGRKYLDFFPGWGCNLLGHCPPRVVAAVREQVGQLIHVPNTWYLEAQGQFAEALVRRAFPSQVFFCNSGTEANEAAIKLARLAGQSQGRFKVISTLSSFHGRTFGALSATGQEKYHAGVGPLLPGFVHVPFGDADAVAAQIDEQTCAILVEPIQGEGGIQIPLANYLPTLRRLADEHGLALIFDEVQTGMGRTGCWFAHQHGGIVPDLMTLAKSLAGGIACGALLARPEWAAHLRPGTHAATFGGNPIACRAGLAFIETVEAENLLTRVQQLESRFQERLAGIQRDCPAIKAVRIRGVMVGLELDRDGTPVVEACLRRGLLINCTQVRVLRLLPAMNLTDPELHLGCDLLAEALQEVLSGPPANHG